MTPQERESIAGLRVVFVSHGYGYGGDLMYFGEIFRCFRDLVPNMAVVVDGGTRFLNRYGIELLPLMRLKKRAIRRTTPDGQDYATEIAFPDPALFARLLNQPADVFVTIEFTLPALITTLAATLRGRKRLVLLVESDPVGRGASANVLVRWVKRWAVRRAQVIQTNNERGRRYLVEDLGAPPASVRVAPYLTSRPPGPETVIGPRQGPLRILFANSINPRKGLRELLVALACLDPGMREQIALTVVGNGPEREELEERAAMLAMGDRIRFVGRKRYDELGAFYASADVLAIPSLADYRSLSGFEGLGYGLALLSSRHDGATEETVVDGVNGFVVEPRDSAGLAARIGRLAEDRELLLRMRHASHQRYLERFSVEMIAENIAQSVAAAARA